MIHSLSHVSPQAKLAANITVEPFSTIAADVEIGEGTWIGPNVTIMDGARIGKNCRIFPGAVIGGIPQDLKFKGEKTTAIIGDNTTIRESVTVNRGTASKGSTEVGSNCLLMAYVHVAHDCRVGNNVILGNGTQLAGEVEIFDWAILSGLVAVHQFCRIGEHVMISGGALVRKDVPPYVTAAQEPLSYMGINSIGLKRRGFQAETLNKILDVYRLLFTKRLSMQNALEKISKLPDTPEKNRIVEFVKSSERGIIKGFQSEDFV